jgi:Cytochrome c biogenesis factor
LDTVFLNEHLLPGQIGHFLVVLSFTASIIAMLSYIFSAKEKDIQQAASWRVFGRSLFFVHSFSVFGVFITLFYIIFNHLFEYHYVWAHSSKTLPFKYLLSCFWEGQEGSFLLWSIWHCLLSFFVFRKGNELESPVMAVVSSVQVFLSSLLLGIHISDFKIGNSPLGIL